MVMSFDLSELQNELNFHEQNMIEKIVDINKVESNKYRGSNYLVEMVVKVNGELATIFVGFKDDYPSSLPLFFDLNNYAGRIPHKEKDGFLCFTNSNSIVIDKRYPVSLLLNCLEKVINLIEMGINRENQDEFLLEFEAYWRHITQGEIYGAIDTDNKSIREVNFWVGSENNAPLIASEKNLNNTDNIVKNLFHIDINQQYRRRCIYIPLNSSFIYPPESREDWDYSYVKSLFRSHVSEKSKKKFQRITKQKDKRIQYGVECVIFGFPLANGNTALFAYLMNSIGYSFLHPLIQKPKDIKLIPLKVNRWHPKYLLNRTGGNASIINKHIVVIGVGSVGSEIVTRLAKSGIQHLTVIDNDVLEPENVYRHSLGYNLVYFKDERDNLLNIPKVLAVKSEIESKYPFTQVTSIAKDIKDVWRNDLLDLNQVDLVVAALGAANQEMDINEMMHSLTSPPPTLYAWNEPLGIGGHSLVTLNKERTGCYQCLFKPNENQPIHNRSSFTKPNQDFSKDLTGCGSIYIPYSFLDSEKTATLAVENVWGVLTGKIQDNPLLSWKGCAEKLETDGFETSYRYEFNEQELYDNRLLYKDKECPICVVKSDNI